MSDTLALFDSGPAFDSIPIIDADLKFMRDFYRAPLTAQLMQALLDETVWRQEKIMLWGQERLQPRLSAWYGDAGSVYTYSGMTFEPLPWSATMLRIKEDIERTTSHRFNSVLLNLYRNENDSVGWHSDNERELGATPVIASLSLGETRVFRLRHKARKELKAVSLELTDGSLLLMAGGTQEHWQHTVPKERTPKGARINLTFRTILQG